MQTNSSADRAGSALAQGPPTSSREARILEHYPLVRTVALRLVRHYPAGVDVDDLIAAGALGLIDAVDRFEPERGVPFAAYANVRIRGAIVDAVRDADWMPRRARRRGAAVEAARSALSRRLGREPDGAEVAAEMEVSMDTYNELRATSAQRQVLSLNQPVTQEGETPMEELLAAPGESVLETWLLTERSAGVEAAINALPERERFVIEGVYRKNRLLRQLGEDLGVSESRVCQIHTQAIRRLRSTLGEA